jgi:hypothetical protein
LENLDAEMDINRAWEIIREHIKILAEKNLRSISLGSTKDAQNY